VIGMKTFSILSDKRYELMVLSDILGGGMSSRLFKKIREEMGAAYYVGVSPNLYATHGYLAVFAGLNREKFYVATKAIYEEMQKMAVKKVSKEELSRAKDHLIGTFLLSLETSDQLAFFYGNQEAVSGKMDSPEEIIKKIKSVNESKILSLAKNIFNPKNISVSVVGSMIDKGKLSELFK
jgi:predicted Zn-dependent peptidase